MTQHTNGTTGQGTAPGQVGIGGATSGAEDATPSHESMAETGGSGGDALTQPRDIETAPRTRDMRQDVETGQGDDAGVDAAEGAGTDATAITRGYQDTRSRQASPGATGLGAPETGGNQGPDDLAPPRR